MFELEFYDHIFHILYSVCATKFYWNDFSQNEINLTRVIAIFASQINRNLVFLRSILFIWIFVNAYSLQLVFFEQQILIIQWLDFKEIKVCNTKLSPTKIYLLGIYLEKRRHCENCDLRANLKRISWAIH